MINTILACQDDTLEVDGGYSYTWRGSGSNSETPKIRHLRYSLVVSSVGDGATTGGFNDL